MGGALAKEGSSAKFELTCSFMLCFTEGLFVLHMKDLIRIDTGIHPPIKLRPYRTPFAKNPIVDKAVNDMLAAIILHPSRSLWRFLIVVVDKKDGTNYTKS